MADRRCNTDDEQLFADWVRDHGRAVRGFLLAMVRRPDVADDLSQEVFCRAWQARSRYREQGNARAYLLRIADRLVCDRGRRAEPAGQPGARMAGNGTSRRTRRQEPSADGADGRGNRTARRGARSALARAATGVVAAILWSVQFCRDRRR